MLCPTVQSKSIAARFIFESLALWKEQNPVYRANIARQLAELAATLAEMEAETAKNFTENNPSSEAA